ncbi:MAG TPA: MFS transporter, partial [Pseudobacillus sp.]
AALSSNFSFFLAARVVQGFSVACILPVAIAYIGVIFPPEKRGMASGLFTAVQGIASTSGAVIAGFLVQIYGWPIIYWISGVLAVIGFFVVKLFVPESTGEGKRSLDVLGVLLLLVCTGCLLSVSTLVKSFGIDSPYTLGTLGAGVLSAILLWIVENRLENPVIELSLLKRRLFALAVITNLIVIAAYQAFIYAMNFFLSSKPGGDVGDSGLFYMFIYGASVIGALSFGKLADKFDGKKLLLVILTMPLAALFLYSFIDSTTPFSIVFALACFFGFGLGAITPIIIKYALSEMPSAKYGAGSGLFSFLRDFGAPLGSVTGIVLFSSLTDTFTKSALSSEAKQAGISPALMGEVEKAGSSGGELMNQGLASELQSLGIQFETLMSKASSEGLSLAIQNMAYIIIAVFAVSFILALFIPNPKSGIKAKAKIENFDPVKTDASSS